LAVETEAAPSPNGAAPVAPAAAPIPAPAVAATHASMLARLDELHRRRDDRTVWTEQQQLVATTLARAPTDYPTLWRAARYYFWLSDDPSLSNDQRSRLGKQGWDLAERAIASNQQDVAGHYWAAVCMGNYALGLGVIKAVSKGLEGKFKERLKRAGELNRGYEQGSIDVAWGRFYDKLPWPKRDKKKAEQHLRLSLQSNPFNLRARVYLASLYMDWDRAAEAKRLLEEVGWQPLGKYDPPEERRAKALAQGLMPEVLARLK
jgi:hypothetical protein